METRRDESKKKGNYKGFCQLFYSGVKWEVKRTITWPFVLSSAWLLLSNTVMAKTNISSTVIMQYILHLIRGSKAGPKQPLSAFWLADKHQLVSSFETTAWMLISVSVIHAHNYKISNKLFVHVNTGGFLLLSQINFDALCLWKAGRRTHTKLWQIDIIQYLAFVRVFIYYTVVGAMWFSWIGQSVRWHKRDSFWSVWTSLSWDTWGCSHRSLAVRMWGSEC